MGIVEKAAIYGAAGAIGPHVAAEFSRRGIPVRVVGRNRGKLEAAFGRMDGVEIFEADLADLRSASAAARGVDTIVYSVGLPLPSHHLLPEMMRTAIEAAVAMQVNRIALVSSTWSYGVPRAKRVAETHPRLPESRKGQYRKEQEDLVLEAQKRGQIDGTVIRLPMFYGPAVETTFAHQVFKAAVEGRTANWIGPVNTDQEMVYVPDAGPAIVELASSPDAYGEAWNFGGPGPINTLDFITRVYRAVGRPPKYRTAGRGMLKVMGWVNPFFKELPELLYLFETPLILDDTKFMSRFQNVKKTPYDEGIRQTLDAMRAR